MNEQELSVWKATDHSFVCSEHFTDDSFEALTWPEEKKALKPKNVQQYFINHPKQITKLVIREEQKGVVSEEEEEL